MLRLPRDQNLFPPQTVNLHQIIDPLRDGPWEPDAQADILLLGDSFTNIYSDGTGEQGLGWGQSAGFAAQLSRYLERPIDVIAQRSRSHTDAGRAGPPVGSAGRQAGPDLGVRHPRPGAGRMAAHLPAPLGPGGTWRHTFPVGILAPGRRRDSRGRLPNAPSRGPAVQGLPNSRQGPCGPPSPGDMPARLPACRALGNERLSAAAGGPVRTGGSSAADAGPDVAGLGATPDSSGADTLNDFEHPTYYVEEESRR